MSEPAAASEIDPPAGMAARPILATMIDAAVPDWAVRPPADVIGVYLDSPHAAHAWTPAEWAVAATKLVNPIWVCGPPFDAGADAAEIVRQLDRSPIGPAPKGIVVTIDVEHYDAAGAQGAGYVELIAGHFLRDYTELTYCSASDRWRFPDPQWLGDWTSEPHDLVPPCAAVQWHGGIGARWDVSAIFDPLPFWNPQAHAGGPTLLYPGFDWHPTIAGAYAQCGADGSVFCYGGAPFLGSLTSKHVKPAHPITSMAWTPSGLGYVLVSAADGGLFMFGDAAYHGHAPNRPIP